MIPVYEIDVLLFEHDVGDDITISSHLYPDIAQRLKIPSIYTMAIHSLSLTPTRSLPKMWKLLGNVNATVQLCCAQSKEQFDVTFDVPFDVMLSDQFIEDDEEDIEILNGSKVDVGEIAVQYLALEIPIYPVHPKFTVSTDALYPIDEAIPEWKAALQKLVK